MNWVSESPIPEISVAAASDEPLRIEKSAQSVSHADGCPTVGET
jgi:hypothetical protein